MRRELAIEFSRVTEAAALAGYKWLGRGDKNIADGAAVAAMRHILNQIQIDGEIVIGEGEIDEAPMLYIGEKVGTGQGDAVDIAVDPIEGTRMTAMGQSNALAVLAVGDKGSFLKAPDMYMEKLIVPPPAAGLVDLTWPVSANLKALALALQRSVEDLVVVVLDRPRHERLIREIREAGARVKLISDGDVIAALAAAIRGTGVHAVMGIGGAPEGVLAAAALKCLGGEIQARFVPQNEEERARLKAMGGDEHRIYKTEDLAPGKEIVFAATGITDGDILEGVRFFGGGARTHSIVMGHATRVVRFIDSIHLFETGARVTIRV